MAKTRPKRAAPGQPRNAVGRPGWRLWGIELYKNDNSRRRVGLILRPMRGSQVEAQFSSSRVRLWGAMAAQLGPGLVRRSEPRNLDGRARGGEATAGLKRSSPLTRA